MFKQAFLDVPPIATADGAVTLPGSKSISNRVLLLAALCDGATEVHDLLASDDTHVMLEALKALGCEVTSTGVNQVRVVGLNGRLRTQSAALFLGNAGTAMRPLTAALTLMASTQGGSFEVSGVPRMHERPIGDLVDALRALGGIVTAQSLRIAGDELDEALLAYLKKEFSLAVGERTAEEIKMAIGSAYPLQGENDAEIRGRDLATGLPKTIVVTAAEIRKALEEPVNQIVNAVKATLDKCPPELSSDLMDRGIVLTGGGALLKGLDERLRKETGMPIHIADRPLDAVVEGSGKCIEEFEALEKVLISEPRR